MASYAGFACKSVLGPDLGAGFAAKNGNSICFTPAMMLARLPGDLNNVRQAFDSVQNADQLTKALDL